MAVTAVSRPQAREIAREIAPPHSTMSSEIRAEHSTPDDWTPNSYVDSTLHLFAVVQGKNRSRHTAYLNIGVLRFSEKRGVLSG